MREPHTIAGMTDFDVAHLARLARITLTDDERVRVEARLRAIVAHVDRLQAVDVSGVEPMVHPHELVMPRRDDVVVEGLGRRTVQGSAGYTDSGMVRVPKVIE